MCGSHLCGEPGLEPGRVVFLRLYDFKVIIYDNTLTNFANNTVQNKSFGRYFYIQITVFPSKFLTRVIYNKNYKLW